MFNIELHDYDREIRNDYDAWELDDYDGEIRNGYDVSRWGRYLQVMLPLQPSGQHVIKKEWKWKLTELCTMVP
jgi:hypothetical protein